MESEHAATLVVIEYGATYPRWLDPAQQATGDLAVVAQHYEGEPMSLVVQVANRVGRLERRGWNLHTVVLVSNGRSDLDAVAVRAVLARGLLARMRAAHAGRLVLTVDPRLARKSRHSLRILAGQLTDEAAGSGVSVVVRVGLYESVESSRLPKAG